MLKFLRKYRKRKEGATAVEFSFLLMPYVIMSLGIIELSLMFTAESLLEGATHHASRQVKTGTLQQSGAPNLEEEFREELCSYATVLIRCEDVVIEARTIGSFNDTAGMQPDFDEDGNMVSSGFAVGGSSERVMIRVAYRYTSFTPLVGTMLLGADNSRNFMSTTVLQTEPYDFAAELLAEGEI